MQPTIGQQLEEARKKLGLSLREAAEATKVRGDVLLHFETNHFNFDLPEVYKRGFLKLYARLLKLDTDSILQAYIAIQAENGRPQRTRISHETLKRELFGHMSLDEDDDTAPEIDEIPTEDPLNTKALARPKLKLSRAGIIILSTLGVSLILGITSLIVFSSSNAAPIASTAHVQQNAYENITLIATGDVYVVVRQEKNREKLFSGPLKKGDQIALKKEGSIKIQHTQGENLLLEKNGHRYAMSANGLAISQFD